jgi:hypothetical protein
MKHAWGMRFFAASNTLHSLYLRVSPLVPAHWDSNLRLTHPHNCVCFLPAVPKVAYDCSNPGRTFWQPGPFAVELALSVGQVGCFDQKRASTTVMVTDKPTVTVLPPTTPVVICEDSQVEYVEVEFTVQGDTTDDITVPTMIPAGGGRMCKAQPEGKARPTFVGECYGSTVCAGDKSGACRAWGVPLCCC